MLFHRISSKEKEKLKLFFQQVHLVESKVNSAKVFWCICTLCGPLFGLFVFFRLFKGDFRKFKEILVF
jgi:hypothetical protein